MENDVYGRNPLFSSNGIFFYKSFSAEFVILIWRDPCGETYVAEQIIGEAALL